MSTILVDSNREVIPRWRSFRKTLALGELSNSRPESINQPSTQTESFLDTRLLAWRRTPSLAVAADLVNAAFVLQEFEPARESAEFLLGNRASISSPLQRMAKAVLGESGIEDQQAELESTQIDEKFQLYKSVHDFRLAIQREPRNSILYVELARAYTLLSELDKAKQAMFMAIKLSPNNRFILRSASRLFIHTGDKGVAHDILRRADRTRYDSWLLAAEISIASAVGHSARFLKNGVRLAKSESLDPLDLTELAAALAMEEIEHGKNREAKKFIKQAMIDPTENSLAQIAWAARHDRIQLQDLDADRFDHVPLAHESKAWEHVIKEEWEQAKRQSMLWYYDQPFSIRPLNLASYVTATMQRDYKEAIRILEMGRQTNPRSFAILNNLAFSYASNNQPDEAEATLEGIDHGKLSDKDRIYLSAIKGLVAFRRGDKQMGRILYEKAITQARALKDRVLVARAYLFYAREEFRLDPEGAKELKTAAMQLVTELNHPELQVVAEKQLGPETERG